jgi:hypothetical protein
MLQPWLARIVARCDGHDNWRQHFESAKSGGVIPGNTPESEFMAVLEPLVSNGLVWIKERPLPGLSV